MAVRVYVQAKDGGVETIDVPNGRISFDEDKKMIRLVRNVETIGYFSPLNIIGIVEVS